MNEWLVEIRVQEGIAVAEGQSRTVTMEEILAGSDADEARKTAFEQFESRCKFDPVLRRKMMIRGLTSDQCYAHEAVVIEKAE